TPINEKSFLIRKKKFKHDRNIHTIKHSNCIRSKTS
ncbi:MAG: hypothetical protein RL204_2012, partial [Bacteroidota bacterium]